MRLSNHWKCPPDAHQEATAVDLPSNTFPEKNRDLAVGCARLQEVQKAVRYYVDNHHCDVIGRVFHGTPGRQARVSFSPTRGDALLDMASPRDVLHFGSYNYSGLNGHPRVVAAAEAALRRYGTTVSGVRLLVVQLGQTSYAVKASIGAVVDRLYLAVHHTNPVLNRLLKRFGSELFPPTPLPRSQRVFRDMKENDDGLARHGIRFERLDDGSDA